MSAAGAALAAQPYQATDVIAYLLALIGVIFGTLWWRDREAGFGWFAVGLLGLGAFYAAAGQHLPTTEYTPASSWYLLLGAGFACLVIGLIHYVAVPPALRAQVMVGMLAPVVVFMALVSAVLLGAQLHRGYANLVIGIGFATMGTLSLWAARHEPGAGHGVVAVAMFAIPVVAVVLLIVRPNAVALRYVGPLPIIVLAVTMLTASLHRRRRALELEAQRRRVAEAELTTLNESLEKTVAERTDELQRLVEGLEGFNRSISHDLRGSLGGIAGAARLAHDELQRGEAEFARGVLPLIADQAASSQRQLTALLSLARTSEVTLDREALDLGALTLEVVEQLREHLGDADPLPRIEIARDMPRVSADRELLRPVLVNLIGNAIKFTRGVATPRIEIGAQPVDGEVEVFVRDNGVGFEPAAAARLFEPFVRLHGPRFEGHGVGLSIVRRAIERHGGRVWAEGEPGRGAVFRFRLPARAPVRNEG